MASKKKSNSPTPERQIPTWTHKVLSELAASLWVFEEPNVWKHDPDGMPARFRVRVGAIMGEGFEVRISDEQIRQAHAVAEWLGLVVAFGWPPGPEMLARVAAIIAQGGGFEEKRRAFLDRVEHGIELWKAGDHAYATQQLHIHLSIFDPLLGRISEPTVRRELARCDRREAPRIAAALAVAVQWLGDTDEEKSRKAFLAARQVSATS